MWRSRMLWHLFFTYGLLISLTVGILGVVLTGQVERNQLREIEDRLHSKALLIREILKDQRPKEDPLLQRIVQLPAASATRVSLIGRHGFVMQDTIEAAVNDDPRSTRPEVLQAQETGYGMSMRRSRTLGIELMYVALKNENLRSPVDFIRVSMPLANIRSQVADLQRLIWSAAGLTGTLGLLAAFLLARRITRPLRELSEGAEEIAAGAYGHRVFVSEGDEFGHLARSFNHMSERLAAQFAQLDQDRQELRTVLSSMVEGVVAIDRDQRILFANERAGQLLDYPTRSAVGRFLPELIRQRAILDVVKGSLEDGGSRSLELDWLVPGQRTLALHVARLPGSPPRGAVLVFHDNTELRRLERLRQEFVANVSHELKTPLAVIKACVETLIDGASEDPVHRGQFLERIADQTERLHYLILDLLHLARIESETEIFTKEELPLDRIVRESLEKHRTLAQQRRHELVAVPPDSAEKEILAWADEEAVRQILDNLVDNALKYTPEGGKVEVRWGRKGDRAFLQVRDTGIGISEADLPRIFERFYRVDKARSRELGGTGLGLSIVKHLTQAMQGTVQGESTLGQGTCFTVLLPLPREIRIDDKLSVEAAR